MIRGMREKYRTASFQDGKRLFEISGDAGIAFFSDELVIERGWAAGENDVVGFCRRVGFLSSRLCFLSCVPESDTR